MQTAADAAAVAGFYDFTSGVADWARRRSLHGVVAYLHTELFGGEGFHEVAATGLNRYRWTESGRR